MNDDRGNDGFLIVGAFLVALLFLGAAFAGYVVLRGRSSHQVFATATATVTPIAMPPLPPPPVGCVTPPTATTAIPTATVTTPLPAATTTTPLPTATTTSPKPPSLRMGATTVTGHLPPEVIQRIVRQNFGRFRLCYETGLKSDPTLEGKVAVRFVIDADGAVPTAAQDASTTLSDKTVVSCVVRAFSTMSFPKPEGGGIVTVVYPLIFSPGA